MKIKLVEDRIIAVNTVLAGQTLGWFWVEGRTLRVLLKAKDKHGETVEIVTGVMTGLASSLPALSLPAVLKEVYGLAQVAEIVNLNDLVDVDRH